jgi:radical SAM superfamily enzyme YgiQ (UPF0313 family)
MFNVLLCIPPDYDYIFPPLGTPALTAFLKAKGIEAEQRDLNLDYRDFLITHLKDSTLTHEEKKSLLKISLKKFFSEKLKNRYYSDFLSIDNNGVSSDLPYDNNTNSSFFFTERLLSSEHLWQYLEDENENTFFQFYKKENILGFLEKKEIKLLGISIISPSQVIPSFTLGFLVKKHLPRIHVNIGGQWPTLYRRALLEKKELFECFDSIIVFEGETPLYRLTIALKEKKEVFIPNVIFKNTKTDFSFDHTEEDLDSLPCPDFDGLPLDDYDDSRGHQISLTYETSRGCYWSKCAYCVDLPLPKPTYRRKSPQLVVRDIKELKQKYKVSYLMVSDPGLSPRQMLEVSKEILKEGIDIKWWCWVRLDAGFKRQVFEIAADAGLKKINFGFESASDRICALLNKGNKKERSLRIIKDCFSAGIRVDLQTMLGLPQEAFSDGLETVDFLIRNKRFISSVTFNTYYLTPSNFIYRHPQKYRIEYKNDTSLPFRFFIPFENLSGISGQEACLLEKLYYKLLNKPNPGNKQAEISFGFQETLSLAKNISEGSIEFSLNRDTSDLTYLYHSETKNYLFLDERQKNIIEGIKQGLALKNIHNSLAKTHPKKEIGLTLYNFINNAIEQKFIIKKIRGE